MTRTSGGFLLWFFSATMAFAGEASTPWCTMLNSIAVDDNEIFGKGDQRKLFTPYLGRCINEALLKNVVDDIAAFYMQRGYITTRAYLKKQIIADGQVEISVLKGFVEDVRDADIGKPSVRTKTAFAFQKDVVLNLRNIETSLDMFNRPQSSNATFAIKPGSKPGASIIEVKKHDVSPWRFNLGLTGRKQADKREAFLTLRASVDNPFNINDVLLLNLNNNRVQGRRQSSRAGDINYSFPVSSYLLEFVASRFYYQQGIQGINDTFLADGRTDGLRTKVGKVLMRDQTQKINAAVSVYHKNAKNFLAGQLIQVSSYKTTLLQLDLTHNWLQAWGSVSTTYSFYQGTDWFRARKDRFLGSQTGVPGRASLQFQKHTLSIDLDAGSADKRYRFTSQATIQRTRDELFNNDKLSVGSDYTVRGYPDGSLYGNNAWYLRNELTKSWGVSERADILQSFSIFAGVDYGQVRCEADNPLSCGNIYGVALGARTQGKRLTSSLTLGWPLKKVSAEFRRKPTLRMSVNWEF